MAEEASEVVPLGKRRSTPTDMEREYSNILDITPALKKRWTVVIQVLETGHIQLTKLKSEYRRLLFTDSQGTRVSAVIHGSHLPFFENTFEQYKRYKISNAMLTKTETRFLVSSYQHSWTLNPRTLVEPYPELSPPVLPCQFRFTPFSKLYKYADTDIFQNVRGVVVKCFPSEQVDPGSDPSSKRDVVIVYEEKRPLLLTLWNNFDNNEGYALNKMLKTGPMIFAMRVKVTTFNSLSLTTRMNSAILINPPVTEYLQLSNWYKANSTEVKHLLQNLMYKNADSLLPYPEKQDIIPIATAIATSKDRKTAWIQGRLSLPHQDRSFTFTACATCLKSIEADVTRIIKCPACKTDSEVIPLTRATLKIDDGSGSICGTISTPDLEEFIPFTPDSVKEAEENGINVHDMIAVSVHSLSVVAFVRSYETWHQRQPITRSTIVKAYKMKENVHSELQKPLNEKHADTQTSNVSLIVKAREIKETVDPKPALVEETHSEKQPQMQTCVDLPLADIPTQETHKRKQPESWTTDARDSESWNKDSRDRESWNKDAQDLLETHQMGN